MNQQKYFYRPFVPAISAFMLLTAMMDLCKDNTRISTMQEEVSFDLV